MSVWLVILLMGVAVDSNTADSSAIDHELVDFDTQVMPILTKSGCNAGACHGAAAGRGGFHLSLYGSRPQDDFQEIVRSLEGRRINHRQPDTSLLLQKPTEQLNHEGGTRLEMDGTNFDVIKRWITQGATRTAQRRLQKFTFEADGPTLLPVGGQVRLRARAVFSDSSAGDVMPWTVLTPHDPSAVQIAGDGTVSLLRPGRQVIVARYLDRVVPLELVAPLQTGQTANTTNAGMDSSIDGFIDRRLNQLGIRHADSADAAALVRRLALDLTGQLPDIVMVDSYVKETSPNKRAALIDHLIASEAFNEFWTHRLAQRLRVKSTHANPAAFEAYYLWLRRQVATDRPLTEIARQLLLADGSVVDHPPANFYAVTRDPRAHAEFVSQVFLGVRLQCANCHDHPLDAWTQDDYHGLAAIFAGVRRGAVIRVSRTGNVIHPVTGEPAVARIPGGPFLPAAADHRGRLADWITVNNTWFAKAAVNRIWNHLMGRGLVEPVDDLRVTNPGSHPELLDWLAQDFAAHEYRAKHTIRRICLSTAYARSSRRLPNQPDFPEYYAASIRKPLSAEVFMDAVVDVTGVPETFPHHPRGTRAVSAAGLTVESGSLDLLGRCSAKDDCADSATDSTDLSVLLHLLNGDLINQRLRMSGHLEKSIAAGKNAEALVTKFYLRAYSRPPSDAERNFWIRQFPTDDRDEFAVIAEDFLWSLLNSEEFMTNH